jgi:hypothetical protein
MKVTIIYVFLLVYNYMESVMCMWRGECGWGTDSFWICVIVYWLPLLKKKSQAYNLEHSGSSVGSMNRIFSASSKPRTSSLETRLFEETKTCTQGRLETCGRPGQPNNLEPPSNRNSLKFSAWKNFDEACLNSASLRITYFTCRKPSLLASHFWLFQWCLQRPL